MAQDVFIRKTIFEIELLNQKEHKYISKHFSNLINQTFKKFLEKKFSSSSNSNIKIKSLEINLGTLHYNQLNLLENIFLSQLSNQIDFQLKYDNIKLENNVSNYIYDYINNGTYPWWAKNKKLFNQYFEKNISKFKKSLIPIHFFISDYNSFTRLYNLFNTKNLNKYLHISFPKKYNLFEKIYSFKKSINKFNHENNLINKPDIEIIFESINIANDKVKSSTEILNNLIEREKNINSIDFPDFEKIVNRIFVQTKNLSYSSTYLSFLQNSYFNKKIDLTSAFYQKNLSNLFLNKEDFINFFILNQNNNEVLFSLIENSFNKNNNILLLKILNSLNINLIAVEDYILFLQKNYKISSLQFNVFKIFLRFSIVLYISKSYKNLDFSISSLLLFFINELESQQKLNKNLIIKNLQSIKESKSLIVNIDEIFEVIFNDNIVSLNNKKNKEELLNFDLFKYFLKYDETPYWSNISNLNKTDFYNYLNILIKNNDISLLNKIISNLDFKKKYLNDLIDSNYFLTIEIIRKIASENHHKFFLLNKNKSLLLKYIVNDLWRYDINIQQLAERNNFKLVYEYKLKKYFGNYKNIINQYKKDILFYKFFIDIYNLFKKLPQNKTPYILEFNEIFNKSPLNPYKYVFLFISKIFILDKNFFNDIIILNSFLKIINDQNNYLCYSPIYLKYSNHNKLLLNEIINKNIISKVVKQISNNKSNNDRLFSHKNELVSQFLNFNENIYDDYKTLKFNQLIYFVEIGSITQELYINKKNIIRKFFYDSLSEKPLLIKKKLHDWSKDEDYINRFINILNFKKDYLEIINLIHPNLYKSYILMMNNLNFLEIAKFNNSFSISSLKNITKALILSWSYQKKDIFSTNVILNPVLDSLLKSSSIPIKNITIFILRQVLNLDMPSIYLNNLASLKIVHSIIFSTNIKQKVMHNSDITISKNRGEFVNSFLINHNDILNYSNNSYDTFLSTPKDIIPKINVGDGNKSKTPHVNTIKSSQQISEFKSSQKLPGDPKSIKDIIEETKSSEEIDEKTKSFEEIDEKTKSSEEIDDETKSNIVTKSLNISTTETQSLEGIADKIKSEYNLPEYKNETDENFYDFISLQNNLFENNNLKIKNKENFSNDQIRKYLNYIKFYEKKLNIKIENHVNYFTDNKSIAKIEEYLRITKKSKKSNPLEISHSKQIFDLKEGVLINNSGLILFWPYLIFLFKKIGVIIDESYNDEISKSKAILVCEYLVSGNTNFNNPSNDLFLNKILCGLEVDFIIDFSVSLDKFEIKICDSAIDNVLSRWGKIKSISYLRDLFLNREGLLVENEDSFNLNINSKPQDILLNHLSWGIKMVFHKLMKKRINVDWKF